MIARNAFKRACVKKWCQIPKEMLHYTEEQMVKHRDRIIMHCQECTVYPCALCPHCANLWVHCQCKGFHQIRKEEMQVCIERAAKIMRQKDKKFLGIHKSGNIIFGDGLYFYSVDPKKCKGIFETKRVKWKPLLKNPLEPEV